MPTSTVAVYFPPDLDTIKSGGGSLSVHVLSSHCRSPPFQAVRRGSLDIMNLTFPEDMVPKKPGPVQIKVRSNYDGTLGPGSPMDRYRTTFKMHFDT